MYVSVAPACLYQYEPGNQLTHYCSMCLHWAQQQQHTEWNGGFHSVKSTSQSANDLATSIFTAHVHPLSSLDHTPATPFLIHYLKCTLFFFLSEALVLQLPYDQNTHPFLFCLVNLYTAFRYHLDEIPPRSQEACAQPSPVTSVVLFFYYINSPHMVI